MSERKSINKYRGNDFYEQDFDKLKKKLKKRQKNNSASNGKPTNVQDVRLMAPFSLKCLNCNEYIAKSRKFNAKKETTNETYLGIKIYRFTIRCPRCASSITYRTDPKTADYITESGAVRNYISTQNNAAQQFQNESLEETLERLEKEEQEAKEKEERKRKNKLSNGGGGGGTGGDDDINDEATVMEKLEKKLLENQRENEMNEEIENLLSKNAKTQNISLPDISKTEDQELEELAKSAFRKNGNNGNGTSNRGDGNGTNRGVNSGAAAKVQLVNARAPSKVTKISKKKKRIVI